MLLRCLGRALVLLPVGFVLSSGVPGAWGAAAIPWSRLAAGDLLANERETAAKVIRTAKSYHGCTKTIASCLRTKKRTAVAWRLARYVVYLAGKGLNAEEIAKLLDKRKQSAKAKKKHRFVLGGFPRLGPAKAKIQIVEFADFQCAHCAHTSPILKKVLKRLQKKHSVSLVFKPYPLREGGPVWAAKAALAAQLQGKFWPMHDLLFSNPDSHTPQGIVKLARQAKLDLKRFEADLSGKTVQQLLDLSKVEGLRSGLKGTPTLFVNGRRYGLRKDAYHLTDRLEEELDLLR